MPDWYPSSPKSVSETDAAQSKEKPSLSRICNMRFAILDRYPTSSKHLCGIDTMRSHDKPSSASAIVLSIIIWDTVSLFVRRQGGGVIVKMAGEG